MSKEKKLPTLLAVEYLLRNGFRHSEWAEAGLLNAVDTLVFKHRDGITEAELDRLIQEARDN